MNRARGVFCLLLGGLTFWAQAGRGEVFRVVTYNVENYLDAPGQNRHVKPEAAKAKVRESILAAKPDVLALQEMGTLSALQELRTNLKTSGLDFPYWEHITGYDTNVHLAILSRFPLSSLVCYTNDQFLIEGRRFRVSRGFVQVDVHPTTNFSFTLINAHLKSKRPIAQADEAELRAQEAKVLREKVDALLASNPNLNLVVLGDLNDNRSAKCIKEIIGKGKTKLVDTRPHERSVTELNFGETNNAPAARSVAWTHYYVVDDVYSRLDYTLISRELSRHWLTNEGFVLAMPNWGVGSDHRPVITLFDTESPVARSK